MVGITRSKVFFFFRDPYRLNALEVQISTTTLQPLAIPPPTFPSFSGLVQHIYDQLHPYLVAKQNDGCILSAFVAFIVGSIDHPNARYALHSHLEKKP